MSTQSGFDLSQATPVAELEDAGIIIEISTIDGVPMTFGPDANSLAPVTMKVAGSYSTRYRKVSQAQTTKALKRRGAQLTGELLDRQRLETISACVLEWSGFFNGDVPLTCDPKQVREVLRRCPWIREQVESAIDDHEAFFEANS